MTGVAQDGATAANWLHYHGTEKAWRHSSLNQVTAQNVKRLAPVWVFQTGDYEGGLQSTPLVEDGVMYVTTSRNRIFALDAATGKEKWRYLYQLPRSFVNRWNLATAASPSATDASSWARWITMWWLSTRPPAARCGV